MLKRRDDIINYRSNFNIGSILFMKINSLWVHINLKELHAVLVFRDTNNICLQVTFILPLFFYFSTYEIRSHYIVQVGLELIILLHLEGCAASWKKCWPRIWSTERQAVILKTEIKRDLKDFSNLRLEMKSLLNISLFKVPFVLI